MMDFITNKTSKVMELALDGLAERHKAISSNIANANTSGYLRSDVTFEGQLQEILTQEDFKSEIRMRNSYSDGKNTPLSVNVSVLPNSASSDVILKNDNYNNFKPETIIDTDSPEISNGNNVNIESEMVELSKNGSRYNVLTQLESRYFRKIESLIKGAASI